MLSFAIRDMGDLATHGSATTFAIEGAAVELSCLVPT